MSALTCCHMSHRPSDSNEDNDLCGPDITDETFEISVINTSTINPKTFAQYCNTFIQMMLPSVFFSHCFYKAHSLCCITLVQSLYWYSSSMYYVDVMWVD